MAERSSGNRVVVYAAMTANFVIMVAKFGAAAATGSSALLAEGIHSLADTGNEALLLLGEKRGDRPPDAEHPFGYGQEVYFWALIVAMVLFAIGGGLSIYEGVHHILAGRGKLEDPTWNYVVLGVAALAEGASWVVGLRRFLAQKQEDLPFREALRRSKDPSLYIPLGEDTAALVGLLVAFLGVYLSHRLDAPWIDAALSIVIGGILAVVAVWLSWETRGLLIGERADPRLVERIRQITSEDGITAGIGRILTLQLSPDEVLLNLEVRFRSGATVEDAADAINRLERRLRDADPHVTRVFVEPQGRGEHGGEIPPF